MYLHPGIYKIVKTLPFWNYCFLFQLYFNFYSHQFTLFMKRYYMHLATCTVSFVFLKLTGIFLLFSNWLKSLKND